MKSTQRLGWLRLGLLGLVTLMLSACGGGGGGGSSTPAVTGLTVTPTTMAFSAASPGVAVASQNLTILNSGTASPSLNWTASVTAGSSWLSIGTPPGTSVSGTLAGGQSTTVAVSVNTASLAFGSSNSGTITVTSGTTTKTVNVTLTISAQPAAVLGVTPTSLTFTAPEAGTTPAAQQITIANSGPALSSLTWTLAGTQSWLSSNLTSGTLNGQSSTVPSISVDIAGLPMGTYTDTLTISAPNQTSKTVTVTLTIGQALSSSASSLSYTANSGTNPATQAITLANASSQSVGWTATSNQQWLSISPANGTLAAGGQSTSLTVSVASQSLAAGSYSGKLTITPGTAAVTGLEITVFLTVNSASAAATQSVRVGGTAGIGQLSSLVAAKAGGVRKAAVNTPTVLIDAKVTITVIKPDGSKTVSSTATNDKGAYNADIKAEIGDTVTVTIEKQGYTTYTKSFTVKEQTSSEFTVSGNVAEAATLVAKAESGVFKASGGTAPGFRFGLMRKPSGERTAFASGSVARAAASGGSKPEIDISIPTSWAPGATAVTAQLAAFNPNVASERQMFPGEFVGVGGGTAAAGKASVVEYPLESVAFFQSEVTPNNGQPLSPTSATGASKAAGESTVIYKYIPSDGCGNMQKYDDRDPNVAGAQVPIYSYNGGTGKWVYIGEGTVKTWNATTQSYDTVAITPGGSLTALSCGTTDYYFEIVTNEWYTWWNLDYPLLFAQPKIVTISGTVKDQNNNPIPGAFIEADGYAKGGNSYYYAYANSDGTFSIDVTVSDASDAGSDATNGKYVYTAYNYISWPPVSKDFTSQVPVTPSTTAANNVGTVTLQDTAACIISGKLTEETASGVKPFVDNWLYAWNSDYSFYNWAQTDATGQFSMKATCNDPITMWVWGQEVSVNVNNAAVGAEASDNGTTVALKDIKRANAPPEVWTWAWPNPVKAGQPVDLEAWSWDYEGDYPLTTAWEIRNSSNALVVSSTLQFFSWTPTTPGNYTATVVVSDSRGASTTQTLDLEVVDATNSAPIIWWTWADQPQSCGAAPTLYGNGYDPDGDTIVYRWQQSSDGVTWSDVAGTWTYPSGSYDQLGNPITTSATGTEFSTATYWYFDSFVPTVAPTGQVRLVVVDQPTVGTPKEVWLGVELPISGGIDLYYAEAWPTALIKGNTVDLYAYAWDNNLMSQPSYGWSIKAPDNSTVTPTQVTVGDDSWVQFNAAQVGNYQVTLTVTGQCSTEPIVRTFTVAVSAPLSVNVTIE